MEKVTNCPNNAFDCGVGCGLIIMAEAIIEILEKIKDDKKRVETIINYRRMLHGSIHEKHLEHMEERYNWKEVLSELLEKP